MVRLPADVANGGAVHLAAAPQRRDGRVRLRAVRPLP